MALKTSLISYWKLDEASGNALDAHGSNNLTETSGTIASATGKINNGRDFGGSSDSEYFAIADNSDLSTGDIDFSFSCWFKVDTFTGFPVLAHKGWQVTDDVNKEWVIYINDTNPLSRILTVEVKASSGGGTVSAANFGHLSTGTWYFAVIWHDSVNNILGISVNDIGNTVSYSGGTYNGNRGFELGASSPQGLYHDGIIDEAGFWKKVLSSDERTRLYNSGNGLSYDDFDVKVTPGLLNITLDYDPVGGNARVINKTYTQSLLTLLSEALTATGEVEGGITITPDLLVLTSATVTSDLVKIYTQDLQTITLGNLSPTIVKTYEQVLQSLGISLLDQVQLKRYEQSLISFSSSTLTEDLVKKYQQSSLGLTLTVLSPQTIEGQDLLVLSIGILNPTILIASLPIPESDTTVVYKNVFQAIYGKLKELN